MANKRIQFKDGEGNKLYPQILGTNIPDASISEKKLDAALTQKLSDLASASSISYEEVTEETA